MDWEDILEGKRADLTDRLNMGIREEGVKGFAQAEEEQPPGAPPEECCRRRSDSNELIESTGANNSLKQQFLNCGPRNAGRGPGTLLGGLRGQIYVHDNPKISRALISTLAFTNGAEAMVGERTCWHLRTEQGGSTKLDQ